MKTYPTLAIQLDDISKKYEIHHDKPTLVERFSKEKNETFWALKNINLTIHKGEKIGIIGSNGSGKTTLLKILAGITTPTSGNVHIQGRIVSLIDLGAGFHADLSGYQNIYLNAMLLGLSRKEINERVQQIITFADLKQFIDAPLFTYSNGMMLRLGFSIAVHAQPDILLLDENLSAGDNAFQKRAAERLRVFFRKELTIVVVSHNIEYIRKMCSRIIWIDKGSVLADGNHHVLHKYLKRK